MCECRRAVGGWLFATFAVVAACCGCGKEEVSTAPPGTPSAKESLTDLTNLLNHLKSEGKQPPLRVEDIAPIEPIFQASYLGLVRGDIMYVWGTTIDTSGASKVLAYEKAVETSSGWVLMQDGSLTTMTASDFQAAPKATK